MANPAFRLHGAGCGLADRFHGEVDLRDPRVAYCLSRRPGDGGIEAGRVVFRDDLVRFAGRPWEAILADLLATSPAGTPGPSAAEPPCDAGGPALVSLALASQLLRPSKVPVTYYGLSGDDAAASRLRWLLAQTPLDLTCFRQRPGRTAMTHVFSEPRAAGGQGDRFFVHVPGTAPALPDVLGESFHQATVALYAGTALVPDLHRALPDLLAKSRRRGAVTVVATVHDAAADRDGRPWTLGGDEAWPLVDLLVGNEAEILRYGGRPTVEASVDALLERGLLAAVATRGAAPVYYRSVGGIFGESRGHVPVPAALAAEVRDRAAHPGDTTGAGDNFLGGLLAAFFHQWLSDDFFPKGEVHLERELHHMNPLRLRPAIGLGVVAGALACLQHGGLRLEKTRGERLGEIRRRLPAPASEGRWSVASR
jgi:sugar/nucleoside kinase (ribokinase family)